MNRGGISAFNFLKFVVTNLFGKPTYLRNLRWQPIWPQALICLSQDFKYKAISEHQTQWPPPEFSRALTVCPICNAGNAHRHQNSTGDLGRRKQGDRSAFASLGPEDHVLAVGLLLTLRSQQRRGNTGVFNVRESRYAKDRFKTKASLGGYRELL